MSFRSKTMMLNELRTISVPQSPTKNELEVKTPKDYMLRPVHVPGQALKDDHVLIPISPAKMDHYKSLSKKNLER